MYESLPWIIFKASAILSVNDILLVVEFPPKTISNPANASSTTKLSHAIEPTFVILPSLTLKLVPTKAPPLPAVVHDNIPEPFVDNC